MFIFRPETEWLITLLITNTNIYRNSVLRKPFLPFKNNLCSTFAMFKPDVFGKLGKVLSHVEQLPELRIAGMRLTTLSEVQAKHFYAEHKDRDFYQ